jgi:hypothetical protein
MNKIARFKEYSKNEELMHGYDTDSGGSSLLSGIGDKFFGWLGRKSGNLMDASYKFIEDEVERQVKSKEIKEDDSDLVISRTNGIITKKSIEGKSEEEIAQMILDYIKYMKDEILPQFTKPGMSEKRYYQNLKKIKN